MRHFVRLAAAALLMVAVPPAARAAIEIDLATAADWTALGARAVDDTGYATALGDVNGDGMADLVFSAMNWNRQGRVCMYFGPLTFPVAHDLLVDPPPSCIEGQTVGYRFGEGLRVLDVDGDGLDDIVIGGRSTVPGTARSIAGSCSVYRGRPLWPATLSFEDADWTVYGIDKDDTMDEVVGGDVNGDGAPDLVLTAINGFGPANARAGAGEAYILFGPAARWPSVRDLAVDPPDVFIYGADGIGDRNPGDGTNSGDELGLYGYALIADVLGDSIPDLVLGAPAACGPDNTRCGAPLSGGTGAAGEVVVLAGRRSWPATVDLRSDPKDLVVYGAGVHSALAAVAAGDFNGDGKADLVMGAYWEDEGGLLRAGALYLIAGSALLGGIRDLATTPADGQVIGSGAKATLGYRLAVGDIDGDGFDDVIAAGFQDSPLGRFGAGRISVLSGCNLLGAVRDLALDPPEISIDGIDTGDFLGSGQMAAGDLDGDGFDDVLAGAYDADSVGNARNQSGEVYVVRGRPPCALTAAAGGDLEVCAGQPVTLDGSGSVVAGCAGPPEYRWTEGTAVVRDWGPDPRASVMPAASTSYRLWVRCGGCSSGFCTGSDVVQVTVDPDLVPGDLGNSLRGVRAGVEVVLSWASEPLSRSYSLYRSDTKGSWPPPRIEDIGLMTVSLPDLLPPPSLYFYRAAGASCSGREGP